MVMSSPVEMKDSENISTQAAEWLVLMTDEENPPSAAQKQAFLDWKNRDPRHADAVDKLNAMLGGIQQLPRVASKAALSVSVNDRHHQHSWQTLAKTFVLLMVVFIPMLIWLPDSVTLIMADKKTDVGQWQSFTLADNSVITLSSDSAINVDFNNAQRTIDLLKGEMRVKVSKNPKRPFVVKTEHGSLTALGTEFSVAKRSDYSLLKVIESSVAATCQREGCDVKALHPGQQIRVYAEHLGKIADFNVSDASLIWDKHQLMVDGMSLTNVLTILNRFHHGYFYFDAQQLDNYHVSAVLPLDKPQEALALLADSLPIKVSTLTPWWTTITMASK
ncbi:FecR family protein [Methylophaga sulfidovorans]|uniref:FecR family protein n=2 Tax=Methylophaga sulfidovorans TaxID=45496 RepID=A0A1I3W986_9GAMM|nr:FecR family protein [Methylophaga sulfidovorans]